MLLKLLSLLDRDRFDPIVVSLADKGTLGSEMEAIGVPVHAIGMKPSRPTLQGLIRVRRLVRELRPDLIQGWMYHGNLAAWFSRLFSRRRLPVLWNVRGTQTDLSQVSFLSGLAFRLCAWVSSTPERIVNNSRASARAHTEQLGYPGGKWVVIPNGFDTSLFTPSEEARRSTRLKLALSDGEVLIGLIGRYHPMKDHRNFLEAAALLVKRYPVVRFVLAGKGVNTENIELMTWIEEFGLKEVVHSLGERSDMPRLTASLDIATSSSAWGENFPNVLGEAMACGVPCVTTDVGDTAWIVGETGKVVPIRDPDALAAAWSELIELGAEGRQRLGESARARVVENFSLNVVVRQYEALYEKVLTLCAV